ncbi:MAG: hypothetical protein AAF317_14270, partial [Pseudomonadota bacterium]
MRSVLSILLALFWLAVLNTGDATAQQINLSDLFSRPSSEAPANLPQSPIVSPGAEPTASDYGQLTSEADPMLGAATSAVDVFRARLISALDKVPEVGPAILSALRESSATGKASYFLGVALFAALLLMIGRGIAWLYSA